jgi:hypothetical protein
LICGKGHGKFHEAGIKERMAEFALEAGGRPVDEGLDVRGKSGVQKRAALRALGRTRTGIRLCRADALS